MRKHSVLMMMLCATLLLCACAGEKAPEASAENAGAAITGIEFTVPEGFTELTVEGFLCYYIAPDGSNINANMQDKDPAFENVSAELLTQTMVALYRSVYDTEVTIQTNAFERVTIGGYPAFICDASYELNGDTIIHEKMVGIDADKIYFIGYIDMSESWQDAFNKSCASIHFVTRAEPGALPTVTISPA